MTPEERATELAAIADEVGRCTRCPLHAGRTRAVPGEGHPDTEVVFVGEGPGYNEDQQGRPFVGAAGSLLNELLRAIGWRREEVFITNVVKCRPPGNRDPEPAEIAACAPYLRRQLAVLDPALIVTLGRHSLQTFMPGARIGQAHGTLRDVDPATGAPQARALAMYHPAAALRQNSLRETMLSDIAHVPQALIDSRARRAGTSSRTADSGPVAPATEPPVPATATPAPATDPPVPASTPPVPASTIPVALDSPAPVAVSPGGGEPERDPDNQMELF